MMFCCLRSIVRRVGSMLSAVKTGSICIDLRSPWNFVEVEAALLQAEPIDGFLEAARLPWSNLSFR